MVPVVWSHEVTFVLKYGVAPSGLPMIERMRPTGVHDGFDAGSRREMELFADCVLSRESVDLVRAFLSRNRSSSRDRG